jgi:uncharacterized protein (TIGR02246 family)
MDKKEVAKKNFELWNNALLSGNPKKVAELYAEDASFLPTMSGKFEKDQAGAEKYFQHFLEKHPSGEIIQDEVQIIDPKNYLHSGFYNFKVDDGQGGRETVQARFSFVWRQNEQGEWKIIHHHSSVKPK